MSKKSLSLVALVLAAVAASLVDAPRELVLGASTTLGLALAVWAYGRSFVRWVAAGAHYEA